MAASGVLLASATDAEAVEWMVRNSPQHPSPGVVASAVAEFPPTAVMLNEVPTSSWTYGCAPTAAGMLFGYYDRNGFQNMYSGPANGGLAPLTDLGDRCSLIATRLGFDGRTTRGHVDDYYVSFGTPGPDPWETNGWVEHAWGDCVADFLGTSQWKWDSDLDGTRDDNTDGATKLFIEDDTLPLYDYVPPAEHGVPQTAFCHGLRLFAESRGYSVLINYNQRIDTYEPPGGGFHLPGFSFDDYASWIDVGCPVLVHTQDHTMLGVGYERSTQSVYVHDGYGDYVGELAWGGSYGGAEHAAVTCIFVAPNAATSWQRNPETPGDWFDPSNWTTGEPNALIEAEIQNGGTIEISAGPANAEARNLYVGLFGAGAVSQSGGTASFTDNLYVAYGPGSAASYSLTAGALRARTLYVGGNERAPGGAGTLDVGGGDVHVTGRMIIRPDGTVRLAAGTLTADAIDIEGTFRFIGGRLHAERFTGDLINEGGTLTPGSSPGVMSIDGNYVQTAAGGLEVEVTGPGSGGPNHAQCDLLEVSGHVALAGTLTLNWLAAPGDPNSKFGGAYVIAAFQPWGRTGQFDSVEGGIGPAYLDADAGGGLEYDDPNGVIRLHLHALLDGDADLNGTVGFADFRTLLDHWGQQAVGWEGADFDFGGGIALPDFRILLDHWGRSVGGAAACAPEPAAAWLSAFWAVATFRRRRSRRRGERR